MIQRLSAYGNYRTHAWIPLALGLLAAFTGGCEKKAVEKADAAKASTPAAGGSNEAPTKLVVGFAQIGAESAWRTANTNSIKDEAAARGIDLKFSDAQQKQENQIRAIRNFIQQKVDVIA